MSKGSAARSRLVSSAGLPLACQYLSLAERDRAYSLRIE